ncbi:methyltransferase [Kitasatospora sp. NPDC085879]|uniref:class I SAM-dependent methyltransferase n=1 Tax=Kitasatospora sp. NPDC085879 TaxID=3154769 RepID=UPI00341EF04C
MKLGIMDQIKDPALLNAWEAMLDLQTRLLGPGEVDWLRAKGFGRGGRGVIEPGSGDGHYGSYLAQCFPDLRIHGLEANGNLIARFDAARAPSNYSIDLCTVGSDPLPVKLSGAFDQCFLRFVLQHVSDPVDLLRAVHDALPPGGRLYIIEEDHFYFAAGPAWAPYDKATSAWSRVYQAGGSDGSVGRKLPGLVTEAGFEVTDYDIVLRNNVEMGNDFLDLFCQASRVLHHTSPELLPVTELHSIHQGFQADRDSHLARFVATYPQILLSATKS